VREKDTAIINLLLSEEEIFKHYNDTTRNEIRRTYDNQDFDFMVNSDFDRSYDLYAQFEKSQGRAPVSAQEMRVFRSALAFYKKEALYGFYIVESFPCARVRSIFSKRLLVTDKDAMKVISNSGRRL